MWKRRIILISLLGALALGIFRLWTWRESVQRRQLATYLTQVNDSDAALRLAAAEGLLRRDSNQDEYRLIRASALIELNRHHEAREQLDVLIEKDKAGAPRFIAMQLESYFAEADLLLIAPDKDRVASVIDRVMALMTGVEKQSALLVGASKVKPLGVMLADARRFDVLSRAGRVMLEDKRAALTKARIGDVQQTMETLSLEAAAIQKQVQIDELKLSEACSKLMQSQSTHPAPVELMFRYHLRRGELEQARGMAKMLASWKELPLDLVGRIADALLTLETQYAIAPSKEDLLIVEQLLNHPKQVGPLTIQYELARAEFMLQVGQPDDAAEMTHQVLKKEWLNARARCLLARAYVDQGDAVSAIKELQKYTELKRDPMVRYTLGLAYLAGGEPLQVNLGQEALRQCLDIEPNHLPARLRLIESLSNSGYILEAADDIKLVEQINPRHPRVTALRTAVAIESENLGLVATLIEQQLKTSASLLRHEDVALVAAMVLDDTARVRRLTADAAAVQPNDIFVLLANRWIKRDGISRGRLAPAIARSLLAFLENDPLTSPQRPRLPQPGILGPDKARSGVPDKFEPLLTVHFMPRPFDVALEAVEIALDRWPAVPSLLSAATELNIWLGRPTVARQWLTRMPPDFKAAAGSLEAMMGLYLDGQFDELRRGLTDAVARQAIAPPTFRWFDLDLALRGQEPRQIADALSRLLTAHPWAEPPLLMTVIDAVRRDQPDRAYALLGVAQEINAKLAHLSRGRFNLGLGRAADALHDVENLLADENADTEVRRWAAEVRARANILMDHQPLAVSVFDQLAATLGEHRLDASLAAVDVLIEYGKPGGAAEVLSELLSSADNPPRMVDRMLARAETVMKPSRLRALVDTLLTTRPNDPVLLLYQARAMAFEDDVVAERVVRTVLSRNPQSPRVLMQLAELLRQVQPDESRKIYKDLTLRGGRTAEAAQRLLDGMNARQSPQPVTASREGPQE